jgi:molybdopterin-guanine dinucleotide biosynthesis protein A
MSGEKANLIDRAARDLSQKISGAILAGGNSRRMGRDKALLELGGRPMIALVAERLREVAAELIIASGDSQAYAPFADRCVQDRYTGVGTLGGIHAALVGAAFDRVLVVGCDMPFLNPTVLSWFVEASADADVVILRHEKGVEPLHALYRRSCLPAIEASIESGQRRVVSFFDAVRVRYVEPGEIAHLDPDLASFGNINTQEEWRAATGAGMF